MIALFFALALPLVEVPVSAPGEQFAVIVTGDGGWRKIDASLADRLQHRGIPTVGLDAAAYYRTRRTPEESAAALEAILREYNATWHRPKAVIIGFSRGADVLPFMINRLPADLQGSIGLIALLGLEPLIDFRYHPSWIPFYHPREIQHPVKPEVEKLRGQKILCVRGKVEKDSLCTSLDPALATVLTVDGGHHFAGHYAALADAIMAAAKQ